MSTQYILHTIDGDLETFSDGEPKTQSCPLLPGQTMNVLDVPLQANLVAGRNVSSSSIDSLVFTLDPKDKYLPPDVRRAATTSAIRQRKARMSAAPKVLHRAASTPLKSGTPKTSTSSRAGPSTLKRQRSLMSVFQRMRQTRSAGSNTKSSLAWPRRIFSRTGQSAKVDAPEDIPEVPKLPTQIPDVRGIANDVELELPIQLLSAHDSGRASQAESKVVEKSVVVPWPQESTGLGDYQPDFACVQDLHRDGEPRSIADNTEPTCKLRCSTPLEHVKDHDSHFAEFSAIVGDGEPLSMQEHAARPSPLKLDAGQMVPIKLPTELQASAGGQNKQSRRAEEQQQFEDIYATTSAYTESSIFSYTLSEDLSPDLASNTTDSGPMSPCHLSQPETPTMSEFEDDYDRDFLQLQRYSESSAALTSGDAIIPDTTAPLPPSRAPPPPPPQARPMTPRSAFSGFQGYSLPQDDYQSVLTIRKLPSTTFPTADARPSFPQQSGKQGLVHSWNDGSEQLLDDLGYLGELII